MLDTRRSRPSTYSSHLIIINTNLAIFNNVAKELYAMLCKRAFLLLCIQLVLMQSFKDHTKVFNMLICRLTVHQNIIQVHSDGLIQHSENTLCIKHWNVAGAFVRPSGMTTY